MLMNLLITATRNLWRSKGSTLINISGLTLGVATSLILFLLVRSQTSFDNYHSKTDRIYRIVMESDGNQIEVGPTIFIIGFGVAFAIAILTVGYRSLSAATANPVDSLRSE